MSTTRLALISTVIAVAAYSETAFGFCQATTCDSTVDECKNDAHGCETTGKPLAWERGDVLLRVDEGGSSLRELSARATQSAVETALSVWMSADCEGGGHPSFTANTELAANLDVAFEPDGPNENDILYMDGKWPYEARAVAKTMLGFSLDTGALLDADMALNSSRFPLAIEPASTDVDLMAVLTHELGHVLGMAHSDVPGATMQPETQGFATAALRTLEPDDVEGICAIYPPGSTEPKGKPSPESNADPGSSGCTISRGPNVFRAPWMAAIVALSSVAIGRRRASAKRRN